MAWVFGSGVVFLTLLALPKYPGHAYMFLIFSGVFNGLLFAGFRKKALFFDTFIGIFLWLGFWFKFSATLLLRGGRFVDATGGFDFSGPAFDRALLVGAIGAAALLVASLIRGRCWFSYPDAPIAGQRQRILDTYERYRKVILFSFVSLFIIVGATNVWLGIYQRGCMPRTILPFGLNGVYTWLLLFGLTSLSAVILDCECRTNSRPYSVLSLALLETFCSSVSMLSRGMIINAGTLAFGVDGAQKAKAFWLDARFKMIAVVAAIFLFAGSIFTVNFLRAYRFQLAPSRLSATDATIQTYYTSSALFIGRWVGIEGAVAVSSYPDLGWNLWTRAWQERASTFGTSLYDREISRSAYGNENLASHHFISMPGILAFCYYPGSYAVLFCSMFLLGLGGAAIEIMVYRSCGSNVILCSLMAQVIAYRYAHFGYAPRQSYLLIGTMLANVLLLFVLNRACGLLAEGERRPDSCQAEVSS